MTFIVVLMTALSCVLLLAGVTTGGFCSASHDNTINLVSAFQNGNKTSNITSFVSYVLTGSPPNNMIVEKLREVENTLGPISANMWIIVPALDLLGAICSRVQDAMLSQVIKEAVPDIEQVLPFVHRDHIYRFYDQIVHQ